MDDSSSSRGKKGQEIITNDDDEDEESGWTSYFEDFSSRSIEEEENNNKSSYCDGGSSLLSDAASSAAAAWNNKFSHHHHHDYSVVDAAPKKLCFKKAIKRAKQISHDDPLEDTASSPVNSPKVRDLNSTEIISSKIIDGSTCMEKEFKSSSEHNSELQRYDDNNNEEVNLNGNKSIECTTDLKKRGLCVVPFSMLVNYLG
ncbi:hypothetical protein HN51_011012 [Arachis hypogaea]|nr:vascular-related unknown protein 1 [Arachis hypogaea]QHO56226.1 uncharacterized protein DS421_3g71910 [Arachis hypogaea]